MDERQMPWRIAVVDDDQEVHLVTRMVLDDLSFQGRRIELLSAYSGAEARELMRRQGESIACLLLDVVMEDEDAGLELVRHIRDELQNRFTRIILRTGMSGSAPEERVIIEYDINDYKEKAELSAQKLKTSVFAALRSYDDLRRVEEQRRELNRAREFLHGIIDSVPSMLAVVDDTLTVVFWNRIAEELTGIPRSEAEGKVLCVLVPELKEFCARIRALRRGGPAPEAERFTLKRHRDIRLLASLHALGEAGSGFVLFRGDDVTLQEQREQRLRRAQVLESIGSLSSGLAHDLNNILGGIIGALALIECEKEDAPQQHNSFYDPYLATVRESADRASGLVKQLLTLTRRESTTQERVSLREVVGRVSRICRSSFDKSVDLAVVPVPEEAVVSGNAHQFEQMLLNICLNGYQAMTIMRGDGEFPGGVLTIRVESVIKANEIRWWEIGVEDTGVGIETEVSERIFDPYFSTREEASGTGLGLAMVHTIVEQFGGELDLNSVPGRGTQVAVRFPALGDTQTEADEPDAGGARAVRILICDDEELMRRVAGRFLERSGYVVLYAADGDETVALYGRDPEAVDAVILDLSLPGESGLEIYRRLKTIRPGVRVLLSSGYQDDERLTTALDEGAGGFLQKPYTMDKLVRKVKRLVEAEAGA